MQPAVAVARVLKSPVSQGHQFYNVTGYSI